MPRPIFEIAREIKQEWPNPYYGAIPYLAAMHQIMTIEDDYYSDTARSVVLYFLSNAKTWRGETARRLKAELKALL